jgi:hypothetical protein
MLSSGLFAGVCNISANVSEHCLFHLHRRVGTKYTSYLPAYEDGTQCSETLAFKLQMLVNNPGKKHTTFRTRQKFEINIFSDNSHISHKHSEGYVDRMMTLGYSSAPKMKPVCTYKHVNCFSTHLQNVSWM